MRSQKFAGRWIPGLAVYILNRSRNISARWRRLSAPEWVILALWPTAMQTASARWTSAALSLIRIRLWLCHWSTSSKNAAGVGQWFVQYPPPVWSIVWQHGTGWNYMKRLLDLIILPITWWLRMCWSAAKNRVASPSRDTSLKGTVRLWDYYSWRW